MSWIDDLEALGEAATPGPLVLSRYDHGGGRLAHYDVAGEGRTLVADFFNEADREFIATLAMHGRKIIAALRAAENTVAARKANALSTHRSPAEDNAHAVLTADLAALSDAVTGEPK